MGISVGLHLVGVVLWVGGLMLLTRVLVLMGKNEVAPEAAGKIVGRLFWGYTIPGAGLTLLTGLYQWASLGFSAVLAQHWFHGKLTFICVLLAATLMLALQLARLKRGEPASRSALGLAHGLAALALLAISFLVFVLRDS